MMMNDTGKSANLTDAENDICFEVKFAIMRGIANIDNGKLWKMIAEAVLSEVKQQKDNN